MVAPSIDKGQTLDRHSIRSRARAWRRSNLVAHQHFSGIVPNCPTRGVGCDSPSGRQAFPTISPGVNSGSDDITCRADQIRETGIRVVQRSIRSSRQDRLDSILGCLIADETASAQSLAARFDVSLMTMHRDLDELQRRGIVRKFRGGVSVQRTSTYEITAPLRRLVAVPPRNARSPRPLPLSSLRDRPSCSTTPQPPHRCSTMYSTSRTCTSSRTIFRP